MYTLGLTGGSGAGKGYVSVIFESYGIHSLDTDKVSRQVCMPGEPCLCELAAEFGQGIIREDGTLDRKGLGAIVFSDREKLMKLNKITHHYILAECHKWLAERERAGDFAAIIDAPQLYESRFNNYCDYVIAVLAERETRIDRIIKRDGITREDAIKRINNQHSDNYFRDRAHFLIYNNEESRPDLQIDVIHQQLRFV